MDATVMNCRTGRKALKVGIAAMIGADADAVQKVTGTEPQSVLGTFSFFGPDGEPIE